MAEIAWKEYANHPGTYMLLVAGEWDGMAHREEDGRWRPYHYTGNDWEPLSPVATLEEAKQVLVAVILLS